MINLLSVAGARPNFMKIAALHDAFTRHPNLGSRIVHTGQHYDEKMSDIFFRQMGLPEPHVYLGIGGGTHAEQTARIMTAFEETLAAEKPDMVIVVGDVNSTLACSLVCAKLHVPVVHVEAGLRSGDRSMPEEINRLVTDAISDLLFVSEPAGLEHLRAEGVPEEKIRYAGNVMIDTLMRFIDDARKTTVLDDLGIIAGDYFLTTLHRPATVDSKEGLATMARILRGLPQIPIVFPMHPRTRNNIERFGLTSEFKVIRELRIIDPIGYLEFLHLQDKALCVITDSGGVQEETTHLNVPCLTLRPNTERPVTTTSGTNELVPIEADAVRARVDVVMDGDWKQTQPIKGWDGKAAQRIAGDLAER